MENIYSYLILVCAILIIFKQLLHKNHYLRLPPSPPALPIIGHLHLIRNSLYQTLTALSCKYGPVLLLRLGLQSVVVVSSPSAIEECFTKNDIVLANRPRSLAGDRLTYNYSAFVWAPYGQFWRIIRRLTVVELFSTNSLQKSSFIREEEIHSILRSFLRITKSRSERIDLNYWVSTFTFNVLMRMVAGECVISEKDASLEKGKEKMKELRETFFTTIVMNMCDCFPILRWLGYKGIEKSLILLHEKRNKFLQGLIDKVRTFPSSSSITNKENKKTLIETLLSLQVQDPDFYTDDLIKSIILIMFVAGTETSTTTIEWAMSLLISHPEALQKLRLEIDNNVGHNRLLNESDIPKLPYLRCVIDETMRLYPPVPLLLPHFASEDCQVEGYDIPKGTTVFVNAWATHRDPKIWEEPGKFHPDRFGGMEIEKEGFKFLPFGMGRRACPGATMGIRTVSLALGTFIQCFDWEKVQQDDMDMSYSSRITLQKAKPLEALCFLRPNASHLSQL